MSTWSSVSNLAELPPGGWLALAGRRGELYLYARSADRRIVAGPQPLLGADVRAVLTAHARESAHSVRRYPPGAAPVALAQDEGLAINRDPRAQGWMAAQINYRRMAAGHLD